jgi:hypothetical protein
MYDATLRSTPTYHCGSVNVPINNPGYLTSTFFQQTMPNQNIILLPDNHKMPNFEVRPCDEEDIPRFVEIVSEAFSHDHEYVEAVFYNHGTPEGRNNAADMMLTMYRHDPNGHFVKVVDTDTSEMVGAAKWNIYKAGEVPPAPELGGPYWPNEEEEEFAKAIFTGFFAPRQKVLQENNGRLVGMSQF